MLDRTAEFARSSNGLPAITPIPTEALRHAAKHLKGRKRDAVVEVADYLAENSEARVPAAKTERLQKLIDAFARGGIAGLLRKSAPHHPSRQPLRTDYKPAEIANLLASEQEYSLRERLEAALLAYKGLTPTQIAKRMGKSRQIVVAHLKDFDAFGHHDLETLPSPRIEASPEVLRAVAAATDVSFTSKRAIAVAMWVEGCEISEIAQTFGVKTVSVMAWLKLFERIGLESLYPARRLELTSGRAAGRVKSARATVAKLRQAPALPKSTASVKPVVAINAEVAKKAASPSAVLTSDRTILKLASAINLAQVAFEAKMTKSYPVKIRLNAISQVARGTEIKLVARRARTRPTTVKDWVRLYAKNGLQAILA